jgi:ABC-type sugar transport system ATPase subunit
MLRREVYTNITLVHLKKIVGWLLQRKVEIATATRSIARLAIRPPDPLMPVGELSGGNQQKVVLAKWLIELNNGLNLLQLDIFVRLWLRGVVLLAALVINVYALHLQKRTAE